MSLPKVSHLWMSPKQHCKIVAGVFYLIRTEILSHIVFVKIVNAYLVLLCYNDTRLHIQRKIIYLSIGPSDTTEWKHFGNWRKTLYTGNFQAPNLYSKKPTGSSWRNCMVVGLTTDRHDKAEILLKVALNTITPKQHYFNTEFL